MGNSKPKRRFDRDERIPLEEAEQAAADSSTRNATLTNKNGSARPSTSAAGSTARLAIRRPGFAGAAAAGADGDPFPPPPPPELGMVSFLIPLADM